MRCELKIAGIYFYHTVVKLGEFMSFSCQALSFDLVFELVRSIESQILVPSLPSFLFQIDVHATLLSKMQKSLLNCIWTITQSSDFEFPAKSDLAHLRSQSDHWISPLSGSFGELISDIKILTSHVKFDIRMVLSGIRVTYMAT